MAVNKIHREFYQLDMDQGWEKIPGYGDEVHQKVLSGTLDMHNKQGGHTRLLRFAPGAVIAKKLVHDYWEEVFVISGDLVSGCNEKGEGGEIFEKNTYCVRPPGIWHGPFGSKNGALLLESHYYDPQ